MKIEPSRDWTELLSARIGRRVRFVVVGGHAVGGHGEPRLTEDLDVFVDPTDANARRLRAALEDFGFGDVAPTAEALAARDKIFMLGRKPWRIDILTGIDGVTFAQAWATKVEAERARVALCYLRTKLGSWKALAKAMGVKEQTLEQAAKRGTRRPTAGFALRAARVLGGTYAETILAGHWKPRPLDPGGRDGG